MQNPRRVAVFIDHSNVFHNLCSMREQNGSTWIKWYDPLKLANKLVGNRSLVGVYFYCTPPPSYLLTEGARGKKQYWKQTGYYEEIKKLSSVNLKYARLSGVKGDLQEKNLDSQINTDMLLLAMQNEYDTAILVANDGDYVSPVEGAKKLGRKVELVYFKRYTPWDLKQVCDISRRARQSFFEELIFDGSIK